MKKNENFLFSSNVKPISKQRKIQSKQEKRFTLRNRGGEKRKQTKEKKLISNVATTCKKARKG
jgi:hypothetical protein